MSRQNYWLDALEIALDEIGAFEKLTKEEIEQVAKSLEISAEHESQACGWDMIPNPENSEIARLKRQLEEQKLESEQRERMAIKGLANRLKLDPNMVSMDAHGRFFYSNGRTTEIYP